MKKIKMNKKVLILLLVMLVAGGAAYYLISKDGPVTTDPTGGNVNLSPATEEDKKRAEDNKQRIINKQEQETTQPTSGTKSVKPVITYAGQYGQNIEVGAYVGGIFEDEGTCTATFTQGARTITKSVQGVKDVNSVACPVMSVSVEDLQSKGIWSVVVNYSSSTARGDSDSRQIGVK